MTKEEKATQYADNLNLDDPYYSSAIDDFIAGYDAAESEQDQLMYKFAEWIAEQGARNTKIGWVTSTFNSMVSTKQLLNMFKDSLKQ